VDRTQLIGAPITKLIQPASQDTWFLHHRTVFKSGRLQECDLEIKRKDNVQMVVRLRSDPVKNERQEVVQCRTTMTNVTALTLAERRLKDSERRFRTLAENSPEVIARINEEMRILYMNRPVENAMGIAPTEFFGRTIEEVGLPDEMASTWIREIRATFESGKTRQTEFSVRTTRGVRHFSAVLVPEFEEGRTVDTVLVTVRDITTRVEAEEARLESLRRLELVAAATKDGIWDIDLAAGTLWHNEAYATAFGYAPDEVVSPRWWRERIHPEDRDQVLSTFDGAIRAGKDRWQARYRFRRKDGSYAWVMARGYVLRDEQGKAMRITGSTTDLTEKLELLDQLESERATLAAILETAQSGIIVVDAQGRPTYANPVFQEIHQRPILVGGDVESHGQLGLMHLDGTPYRPQELPLVRAAMNGETIGHVEMLVERPDGQRRYILANANPLRDSRGEIIGAVAVVQDITELKAIEQALRQAKDELERRVRERTADLDETVGALQREVAEKIEAQTQLMRQNDVLQKIIGSIPVMLYFYDSRGNVAMVNNEFERVLGYSLKDVQRSDLMALLYPDPEQRGQVRQYMLSGEPGWRDFAVQRKRGGRVLSSWANIRLADDSYIGIGIDIRERQRFEKRLRENEQRYRTLVELSPDAICVEKDGAILFVNSTAVKLTGAEKPEDLIGRPIMDFLHVDYQTEAQKKLDTIRRQRVPLPPEEEKIVRLDGSVLDVEAVAMPITFEGGPAIQIVVHDITERKRAEERLRRSAWQLQQQAELLDLAHDTIMVHDMDGRITFWNRGAEHTYGWTKEEAIGQVSYDLLKTRFPHNLMDITAMLLRQGRWDGELTHTTRSGETIIVSSRWALQRDENGRPAAILAIDRDITQQKKAEVATSEARRFAEGIIDTVQEALLALDANLKVISANHTFYDTFQVAPGETQGRYIYEIGHGQWNIPDLRRLLEDILPHDTSFEGFEVEHDFDRIGHRTMVLNARRIYRETQETEMILLAMQDITIRKQQEREIHEHQRQLATLTEELLFAEERERHRLALMLHDSIGQSLAFSRRELGVLQKRVPAEMTEDVENVKEQIDVAIHQTRDLTFELSPTTLHTFGLEAAIDELGDQFARHEGFTFRFEATEETLPLTEQIKTLLYRAARELLMNVAKHADAHNVSVQIGRTDNSIRIRVADDGRGFDVSALRDLKGEKQGFGIFSIRERLTNVGGSFHVASEPGKGTEITLVAPLDVPSDTQKRSDTP
jgi:PAS domain S-box-containing protein